MLRACDGCARHVRVEDKAGVCPFCDAPVSSGVSVHSPLPRLGRAAMMALGAVALAACGDAKSPSQVTIDPVEAGATPTATATATATPTATASAYDPHRDVAKPYGAPPIPEDWV
ncbi:hypothetical protein BH09MYX1_BH09MYX1_02910 [soil metagenome]